MPMPYKRESELWPESVCNPQSTAGRRHGVSKSYSTTGVLCLWECHLWLNVLVPNNNRYKIYDHSRFNDSARRWIPDAKPLALTRMELVPDIAQDYIKWCCYSYGSMKQMMTHFNDAARSLVLNAKPFALTTKWHPYEQHWNWYLLLHKIYIRWSCFSYWSM